LGVVGGDEFEQMNGLSRLLAALSSELPAVYVLTAELLMGDVSSDVFQNGIFIAFLSVLNVRVFSIVSPEPIYRVS
jgi:hypothetical protein